MSAEETMGNREPESQDILSEDPGEVHTTLEGAPAADESEELLAEDLALPEPEPEAEKAPTDPIRQVARVGWAIVAVLAVLAVVVVFGVLRITNGVNRLACIQRAQTSYVATTGPSSTAYELGLARLALNIALNKCGQ